MTTLEKLQAILKSTIKTHKGYEYKSNSPTTECVDGTIASIQASETHYSIPRDNIGPYTHVEVWRVTAPVTQFAYSEDEPSAYVPIEAVVAFLDAHGGIAS